MFGGKQRQHKDLDKAMWECVEVNATAFVTLLQIRIDFFFFFHKCFGPTITTTSSFLYWWII